MVRNIPALVLGVALGGFFDGILLHQILQWHHLFSQVPGMGDLRRLILWDGVFHAAMYVLAAGALVALWRRGPGPGQAAVLLAGFGLWHVLDAVLSHWLLRLHRIRDDSSLPLVWDIAWLVAFGLLPIGVAAVWRGAGRGPGRGVLAMLTLAAGGWAQLPAPGQPLTAVVFAAGQDGGGAVRSVGGEVVWSDPDQGVVLANLPRHAGWRLYALGARAVAGAGLPAGCAGWVRPG